MMWARRRQLAGWLVKESPAAWLPTTTSHSRKSTLMLPPAWRTPPTTPPAAPRGAGPRRGGEGGGGVGVDVALDEGAGRDRPEEAGILQVVAHDVGDVGADTVAGEGDDGDRHRLHRR